MEMESTTNNEVEFSGYADKIYKLLINFTYKETLHQFINDNGQFKQTFYWLLKSICDNG
jgi:hypothetical protein